jgi:dTMP kinase
MSGFFIVFEGVEGSGKSTQARMLADWLGRHGVPHRLTREPGGTFVGEQVRSVLLHGGDMPSEAELLLLLAARAAHVQEVVSPALARGEIVVSDRYELSSFAYQGLGRELGLDRVKTLNSFATGGLRPDLTVLIDVPWEEAVPRRLRNRPEEDRIERAGAEFHARVVEAYRLLASSEPAVISIDGRPAPDVVHGSIVRLLQARFAETFPSKSG